MITFSTESDQRGDDKWIPEGILWIPQKEVGKFLSKTVKFDDRPCETEKEANVIITEYFLERGYVQGKKG